MVRIQDSNIQQFEKEHIEVVRNVGPECTLLLKKDGTFPLKETGKVALYGNGSRKTIKGGTGSGDVNVRHFVTIEEGLENAGFEIISKDWMDAYDKLMTDSHAAFVELVKKEAKELGVNPLMHGMGRKMEEPNYDFPLKNGADLAVYVLSRNSGEGADRNPVAGDIDLSETEIRDIKKLNDMYEKFILVLNVGGLINLEPVMEVKNILLLSQLGTATGDILADILLGKAYPSGKLTTTWAPIVDYPSTEGFADYDDTYYKEGVYVGYRYFDTVDKAPTFPFGFGLSYTEFDVKPVSVSADEKQIKVVAKVTNTGDYVGKEVVQVYVSAPSKKLDKPYQELKGFAKTPELATGASCEVTITIDTANLASYDTKAASYVMEAGEYVIRVGNCSRNTVPAAVLVLDADAVTEKTKNICPGWGFDDLVPEKKTQAPVEGVERISLSAAKIETKVNKYRDMPVELPNNGPVTWQEVLDGSKTMDDFVGTLTDEQMSYLCNGVYPEEGGKESQIGASAVSVAGAAAETTHALYDIDVPAIVLADGPAGLRLCTEYKLVGDEAKGQDNPLEGMMEFATEEILAAFSMNATEPSEEEKNAPMNYVYCIAIPIGTALAQAWNPEVPTICGDMVGKEMEMFGVHIWLAPAMNIHRSPLCGRNFEYYSEDPLVAGTVSTAITAAVQKHDKCAVSVKHFFCNNQETNRMNSNSNVSERALRELYLKGFEKCVKESQPITIMSSYNLVNGEHACNSKDVLTYVLRDEWGFDGLVMTDWYSTNRLMIGDRKMKHDVGVPSGCIKAGNDIIMPGTTGDRAQIMGALKGDELYPINRAELQTTAKRALELIKKLA